MSKPTTPNAGTTKAVFSAGMEIIGKEETRKLLEENDFIYVEVDPWSGANYEVSKNKDGTVYVTHMQCDYEETFECFDDFWLIFSVGINCFDDDGEITSEEAYSVLDDDSREGPLEPERRAIAEKYYKEDDTLPIFCSRQTLLFDDPDEEEEAIA